MKGSAIFLGTNARPTQATQLVIQCFDGTRMRQKKDWVATEEPMEIRLLYHTSTGMERLSVSITMRTPGHDFELAAGFLFSEGILKRDEDVETMAYCVEDAGEQRYNVVNVQLRRGVSFDPQRLARHFYTTSSCGVCGKASLEALEIQHGRALPLGTSVSARVVQALPERLQEEQPLFAQTGGLHGAGLFDVEGHLLCLREDVGRHNAVDKVVGHTLLSGKRTSGACVLMLSGRASFELLQKALVARIPVVAAVGAPSSLAVTLARTFNVTLLGFVDHHRFNVYSGAERLID